MILRPLSRRASLLGLAGGIAALPALVPARAVPVSVGGLVVLTVGGLVGAPNRPPFDAKRDRFFDHSNLGFEKARAFTLADLSGFPRQTVFVKSESGETAYAGPLMHGILAAASPSNGAKTARLSALDGYAAELSLAEVEAQRWVLATEADGTPFGIGDFGPLYAMRQLPPNQKKSEEEGAKWVFSIYYIELMA
jgi:hypothetical protein